MIITFCILSFVIVGFLSTQVLKKMMMRLQAEAPSFRPVPSLQEEFDREIKIFQNETNIVSQLEERVQNMRLPIPDIPQNNATGEAIVKQLIETFEKNTLVFAGTEQIVLQIISNEALYNSLAVTIETLGTQIGQTALDAWAQIQQIGPDALQLASADTYDQLALNSLKSIFNGLKDYYTDPNHLMKSTDFLFHLTHGMKEHDIGDLQDIFKHLFDHDHIEVYRHGGESLINSIHDHVSMISNSISEHSHSASTVIGENFHHEFFANGDGVNAHFPYFTLILASVREASLLIEEKTNLANSLKNISLDVAGTGLGSLGGLKAGVSIGAFFGPLGAAIGGIVGAVGGAIAGRAITNDIKIAPLKEAIEAYHHCLSALKAGMREAAVYTNNDVRNRALESQNSLHDNLGEIPKQIDLLEILAPMAIQLKECVLQDIVDAQGKINKINQLNFMRNREIRNMLERVNQDISVIEAGLPNDETLKKSPLIAITMLLSNPALENGQSFAKVKNIIDEMHRINGSYQSSYLFWSYHAGVRYREALNEILKAFESSTQRYNATCVEWKKRILASQELVTKRKGELGIN